jgi:hypothetical protein
LSAATDISVEGGARKKSRAGAAKFSGLLLFFSRKKIGSILVPCIFLPSAKKKPAQKEEAVCERRFSYLHNLLLECAFALAHGQQVAHQELCRLCFARTTLP